MAKTMYNGQLVETIDVTPTWLGMLPMMLELHTQFDSRMRKPFTGSTAMTRNQENKVNYNNTREEFKNMAIAADKYNEMIKPNEDSYIVSSHTEDTGGGIYSDVIVLKNGYVLRVNELGVALYAGQVADDNNTPEQTMLYAQDEIIHGYPATVKGGIEDREIFELQLITDQNVYYGNPNEGDDNGNVRCYNRAMELLSNNIHAANSFLEEAQNNTSYVWASDGYKVWQKEVEQEEKL